MGWPMRYRHMAGHLFLVGTIGASVYVVHQYRGMVPFVLKRDDDDNNPKTLAGQVHRLEVVVQQAAHKVNNSLHKALDNAQDSLHNSLQKLKDEAAQRAHARVDAWQQQAAAATEAQRDATQSAHQLMEHSRQYASTLVTSHTTAKDIAAQLAHDAHQQLASRTQDLVEEGAKEASSAVKETAAALAQDLSTTTTNTGPHGASASPSDEQHKVTDELARKLTKLVGDISHKALRPVNKWIAKLKGESRDIAAGIANMAPDLNKPDGTEDGVDQGK